MVWRTTCTSVGLALLLMLAVLIASCDEAHRYETMRFFFDGVKPPESPQPEEGFVDANLPGAAEQPAGPVWYIHEPIKSCPNCHETKRQSRSGGHAYLKADVPELCYGCHTNRTASAAFAHGPVAIGQCLFCHHQHKTKIPHLLKYPQPDLCYRCHDPEAIAEIPAHVGRDLSTCTLCHNPHAGDVRGFLKEGAREGSPEPNQPATLGETIQDYIQDGNEPDKDVRRQLEEAGQKTAFLSDKLFQVLWKVGKLVEQGQLQQARDYLGQFKDEKSFTDKEREEIGRVLDLIDRAIGAGRDTGKTGEQEPARSKAAPPEARKADPELRKRMQENADLFYKSMEFYRDGKLAQARDGFVRVLQSGLIPEAMAKTIRGYVLELDKKLAEDKRPPD